MNRFLEDLQKKEHCTDGEGLTPMIEERKQRPHGRKNGEDEDLKMMQHFVRDFIERSDDIEPLW